MPERERPPYAELDRETVRAYMATFIARTDMYPKQLHDGRYISIKKKLSIEHVTAHLRGKITLGAYALDQASQARWICFDADDDLQWQGILNLAAQLEGMGVKPYIEPSRRGGHVWLFLSPMPGEDARRFGKQLLAAHHLEEVELYPKQDVLHTGPGSLVRLPLGRHQLTGRRYHFVTLDGKPIAPTVREQIALLTAPERVPQAFIEQVIANIAEPGPIAPTPVFTRPTGEVPGATLSERLKNCISVYDYVSQFVELDQSGRAFCPFHDDHHKSFGVNPARNFWHCWAGCGGGSIIDFAMKWREQHGQDGSFKATIKALADVLLPR